MKLNPSKTKTIIVSRSRTMHPQSPPFTIDSTMHKESDDLDILGVTFDSNARATLDKQSCVITSTLFEMNSTCMCWCDLNFS